MKIHFAPLSMPRSGALVVGVFEGNKLTPAAQALDKHTRTAISRAIASSRFRGKVGDALSVLSPAATSLSRIVLVGMGDPAKLDELKMQTVGGTAYAHLSKTNETAAAAAIDVIKGVALGVGDLAANFAYGARLRSYRFDKYRTKEKKEDKPALASFAVMTREVVRARHVFADLDKVADGVFFTRDLVSEPANVLYPETLAEAAKTLTSMGVAVEVLDEKKMQKLGMGALLGVGQGSVRPPRLVVMQWKGAAKNKKPIAFVGKGVTFDTGGISIKPAGGMEDMKWDMGGAGVVIGLMKALAGRKAAVNVVGVAGLVENMPSGSAQRPGDVVTSMSGQTIEVLNTDAEGRLVLADALWYCQDRFKPQAMVDLATLTGAIIVALGHEYAGLFSNNDELSKHLIEAGKAVGEELWRLPLGEAYDKMLNTDIADIKNITGSRDAGSITAAQFLKRFVNDVPWAHLDIAGVAWAKKDQGTVPKGGTAFGVRLLDRLIRDHYEKN
ncbi:MAG TPA: leucyl aminopeptidase [Alphaproteobacteria bacterium]|jgi:leucyl aminopeptidase|nr:leucyl aminopeptidase [Alphaproteobacteria bacterium]